jgi:hypothetical protein
MERFTCAFEHSKRIAVYRQLGFPRIGSSEDLTLTRVFAPLKSDRVALSVNKHLSFNVARFSSHA